MNGALWTAKTGLDAQQTRMQVISNNLANTNTTSQDTQLPSGLSVGTGVRVMSTEKLFTQGNLSQTGDPLDIAVQGRGFFEVLTPDGTLAYTRDGSFQVDAPSPPMRPRSPSVLMARLQRLLPVAVHPWRWARLA